MNKLEDSWSLDITKEGDWRLVFRVGVQYFTLVRIDLEEAQENPEDCTEHLELMRTMFLKALSRIGVKTDGK